MKFLAIAALFSNLVSVRGKLFSQAVFDSDSINLSGKIITPQLSSFVQGILNTSQIHGLSLAIVSKGGRPELGTWGARSEEGDEMTSKTLFHIASCSKAFLASALGIMMNDFEEGRNVTALPEGLTTFNWDTKVKDIMPPSSDWQLMDDWAHEKANIRDILSHVSGLTRHDYSVNSKDTPEDIIRRMQFLRPTHELRQKWSYNNLMFMVGAHIINHYTGSYMAFAKERIFEPLGMTSTTFVPSEAVLSGHMSHSWTKDGRRIPQWFTDEQAQIIAGQGGIISNGEDMAKWVQLLLNGGSDVSTNKSLIPRSVFDEVTSAHAITSGGPNWPFESISGYAMGWERASYKGHDVVMHGGAIPGFSSRVAFLPHDELGVVVLINGAEKDIEAANVLMRIVHDALGIEQNAQDQKPNKQTPSTYHPAPIHELHPSLEEYAGTYTDPGYGSFTLCSASNPYNTSYCTQVLRDFITVDAHKPYHPSLTRPQLFASWPRLLSSHVRMVRVTNSDEDPSAGHSFNLEMATLFPEGFGADKTPFETGTSETLAQFVVKDGVVIGLAVFGETGDMTRERGDAARDRAEIWFKRVHKN